MHALRDADKGRPRHRMPYVVDIDYDKRTQMMIDGPDPDTGEAWDLICAVAYYVERLLRAEGLRRILFKTGGTKGIHVEAWDKCATEMDAKERKRLTKKLIDVPNGALAREVAQKFSHAGRKPIDPQSFQKLVDKECSERCTEYSNCGVMPLLPHHKSKCIGLTTLQVAQATPLVVKKGASLEASFERCIQDLKKFVQIPDGSLKTYKVADVERAKREADALKRPPVPVFYPPLETIDAPRGISDYHKKLIPLLAWIPKHVYESCQRAAGFHSVVRRRRDRGGAS